MSGSLPSPFLSTNELLAPMAAYDTHQNQLLSQQTTQQQLGSNEIEMMSRAAATLMDPSQYPTPEARAAAYPTLLGTLQRQGFAKSAPATYPGDDAIAGLARMGMSLKDQYGAGMIISPALKALMEAPIPGVPGYGGAGGGGGAAGPVSGARGPGSATRAEAEGGPPAAGSPGAAVAQRTHDFWIKQGYTEPQVAGIMAGGPGSESDFTPTVFGDKGTSYGLYQHHGERLANMQKYFGLSGSQMPSEDQQNQYAAWEISPQGPLAKVGAALKTAQTPADAATIWTRDFGVPGDPTEVGRRARGAGRYLGIYAGQGAPGGAAATPAVQQGGAPPAPPGSPAGNYGGGGFGKAIVPPAPAPAPASRTRQVAGDVGAIQAGMAQAQATPGLPGGAVAAGPAAPTATATATPGTPEPGWGTGGGVGSYGAGSFGGPAVPAVPPPPPAAVAQTPPPQAQAPAVPPSGTGVNSPQYQAAMALNHRAMQLEALGGNNPVVKARVAELRQQAQLMMQADSYQPVTQDGQQGQRSVLTGKFEAYPARRLHQMPDGRLLNDQGTVIGYSAPFKVEMDPNTHQPMYVPQYPTPAALSPIPGAPQAGGLAGASPVPGTTPDLGFAKEQEAEATRLSKIRDAVIDRANESGAANTMIVNTEKAMEEAQKGNVGPSAIGPHVLNAVAAAKALGLNLNSFGIDTSKVAAGQVTREQLQQLNGAILRKMYPQRITNADLAISGSALPNYGLDPEALTANFDIYKKQNAYDTAKAQDMLDYENTHHTLKGWEHAWFGKNNFAPGPLDGLFGDAATGRLATGGSGQTGQTGPLPKAATDSLSEGHVTTFSNGQRWTLRNGQPIQVK